MKENRQKFYILLAVGITLIVTIGRIYLIFLFDSFDEWGKPATLNNNYRVFVKIE